MHIRKKHLQARPDFFRLRQGQLVIEIHIWIERSSVPHCSLAFWNQAKTAHAMPPVARNPKNENMFLIEIWSEWVLNHEFSIWGSCMDRPRICTGTTPSMLCMPTLSSVWQLICLNQLHKLSLLATFAFATENRLEAVELLHSLVHVSTIKESHSLSTRLISRVVKYNFGIHTVYIMVYFWDWVTIYACIIMHIYYTFGIGLPCMVYNHFAWVTISPITYPPRVGFRATKSQEDTLQLLQ